MKRLNTNITHYNQSMYLINRNNNKNKNKENPLSPDKMNHIYLFISFFFHFIWESERASNLAYVLKSHRCIPFIGILKKSTDFIRFVIYFV